MKQLITTLSLLFLLFTHLPSMAAKGGGGKPPSTSTNTSPIISGIPDTSVKVASKYSFTPLASDADGDNLRFKVSGKPNWMSFSSSTGVLGGTPWIKFEGKIYQITISVTDGTDTVNLPTFSLEVLPFNTPPPNNSPSASAGTDQTINENTSTTLNGTGSSDPDGDVLSYSWTQTAGTGVTIINANTASPSFTAPEVGADTLLSFELTVNDGNNGVSTDSVNVLIKNVILNTVPVATAGNDQTVNELTTVNLSGSGSDADGDTLSYSWIQTAGNSVNLSNVNIATPSFSAPDVTTDTTLTFTLTVNDSNGGTASDSVNIFVTDIPVVGDVPTVSSISLIDSNPTNANTVNFQVIFSESVTGVSLANFSLLATQKASGTLANFSGSGNQYIVSVTNLAGAGWVELLVDQNLSSIVDVEGNNLQKAYTTGEKYTRYEGAVPPVYDLMDESYTFESVWSANQGVAASNNFGKNYQSMSVWRDGFTYVAYVDDQLKPRIAKIADNGSSIETALVADYQFLQDGHHSLSIGMDGDGYLHISGDMHNYPNRNTAHMPALYAAGKCMYWRSSAPFDISAFDWHGGDTDGNMPWGWSFSYMTFVTDREGNLFYYARTRDRNLGRLQVFTVSRYDPATKIWTVVGNTNEVRDRVSTLAGTGAEGSSATYTRIHGWVYFDPTNRMHMTANVIDGYNPSYVTSPHYATDNLYLNSDDGGRTVFHADDSQVYLPAFSQSGNPVADIPHSRHMLATYTSVATDRYYQPHSVIEEYFYDANGNKIGGQMALMGWKDDTGWVNYGNLNGMLSGGSRSRIFTDSYGVMTIPMGNKLVRFFDPEGQIHSTSFSTPILQNIDRSYVEATGNIQALVSNGGTIELKRITIARP